MMILPVQTFFLITIVQYMCVIVTYNYVILYFVHFTSSHVTIRGLNRNHEVDGTFCEEQLLAKYNVESLSVRVNIR